MNESKIRLLELERLKIAPTGPVFQVIFAGGVTCTCRDWQRSRIIPGGWFVKALRIITRASGNEVLGNSIQEELEIKSQNFQKLLRAGFGSELVKKKERTWRNFSVTHCSSFELSSDTTADLAEASAIRKRVGEVLRDHIFIKGNLGNGYSYCSTFSVGRDLEDKENPPEHGPGQTETAVQLTEEEKRRSSELKRAATMGITEPLAMQTFADYFLEGDSELMKDARERLGKEDRNELTDEDRVRLPDRERSVRLYLDFFGRFGHLVELGALPLRTFEKAPSYMWANMLRYMAPEIRKRRTTFNPGEGYWHGWLVNEILQAGYLQKWSDEERNEIRAIAREFIE